MSPVSPPGRPGFSPPPTPQKSSSGLKKRMALFGCLGLLVIIFGCLGLLAIINRFGGNLTANGNQSNPPAAIQPSPSSAQSTPQASLSLSSGGLGLDRAEWERMHGGGKSDNPDSTMYFGYENGKFVVQFSKLKSGNVSYIERVWGDRNAVSIEEARSESKQFIPADAKFVKTYTSRGGSTVDLYTSEALKGRFAAAEFIGGKPGDFIILYRNQTGLTTTFIAGVGNNP
jgi:hypothetical protein